MWHKTNVGRYYDYYKFVSKKLYSTFRQPLYKALQTRHIRLVLLFQNSSFTTQTNLLQLLNILGSPQTKEDVTDPIKVAREVVECFFSILRGYEDTQKMSLAYDCIKYLKSLPSNKAVQMAIIVWTLEAALSSENAALFGAVSGENVGASTDWLEPLFSKPNLMEQNRMLSTSCSSFQLFHTGEIGNRPKRLKPSDPTPEIRV